MKHRRTRRRRSINKYQRSTSCEINSTSDFNAANGIANLLDSETLLREKLSEDEDEWRQNTMGKTNNGKTFHRSKRVLAISFTIFVEVLNFRQTTFRWWWITLKREEQKNHCGTHNAREADFGNGFVFIYGLQASLWGFMQRLDNGWWANPKFIPNFVKLQ